MESGTQAYSAWACLCAGCNVYLAKQAYRVIHQLVSMVSQCLLNAWLNRLASGDQRRLTGSSSALEACLRRCTIQIHSLLCYVYLVCQYHSPAVGWNDLSIETSHKSSKCSKWRPKFDHGRWKWNPCLHESVVCYQATRRTFTTLHRGTGGARTLGAHWIK